MFRIRAAVRLRGAIGWFCPQWFTVNAASDHPEHITAAWIQEHGDRWELNHIEVVQQLEAGDPRL